MSTRAVYSFKDQYGTYHVYKHSDGYPTGAAQWLMKAKSLAWTLPRYEADEFAAAFVAANKIPYWCSDDIIVAIEKSFVTAPKRKGKWGTEPVTVKLEITNPYPGSDISRGGGVRLLHSGGNQTLHEIAPSDIEYRYEVYQGNEQELRVKAFKTDNWDDDIKDTPIFDCRLDDMIQRAKEYEDQKNAENEVA